jgi:hypothetical protein
MLRTILAASLLAFTLVPQASAQAPDAVLRSSGLAGTWSRDCSEPTSVANARVTFDVSNPNRVTQYQDMGRANRTYIVHGARQSQPGTVILRLEDIGDREMTEAVVVLTADSYRMMSNRTDDGRFYIKDGMLTHRPGEQSVTLKRCRN